MGKSDWGAGEGESIARERKTGGGSVAVNAVARLTMYALNLLVPVLVGPYVARVLDVALYGEYNAALSVLQWFLALSSFGVYNYGMRQASRVRDDPARLRETFEPLYRFGILASLAAWLLFMAFVLFTQSARRALYAALSLQVLANCFAVEWVNEAFENYPFLLLKTAAVRLFYVASVFLFVRRAEDVLPYALVSSALVFLNNFLGFLYVRRRVKRRKTRFQEIAALIKPLALVTLLTNASLLYLMLDRLYLSAFAPDKAYVSYYTLPMLLMSAAMNVLSSILFVTVPRLSNYLSTGDGEKYKSLLQLSSHTFFLIAMPVCAGIGALGPEVMLLYGGGQYAAAGGVLMVLGARYVINAFDLSLSNQILFLHGMERRLLFIYFFGGALNVLFKILLLSLRLFDPVLCAALTCVCDALAVFLQHRAVHKKLGSGLSPLDAPAFRYALLSLSFYPVCAALRLAFPLDGTLNGAFFSYLFASVFLCAALYAAALYLARDAFFKNLSERLRARLKRA